ncbi:2Fe-2S iron-sulfur cluster-binding protein [Streptomyces sp. NPDC048282]|uniref:2Fe-2S iron-sulfur cluster-binding protein n=1 Tax=unclassified Streptomyces TaxID=2593676 RepID=UPI00371F5095
MPHITYHDGSGSQRTVTVKDGTTVMRAALNDGVDGIVGECGGQAMCATCHVYVRDEFVDALPPMGEDEHAMLDFTAAPRDARRSRLGCQITMGAELHDLEVDLPSEQV